MIKTVNFIILTFLATCSTAFHNTPFCPFYQTNTEQIQSVKQHLGKEAVLQMSSFLPKFDTVGHDILKANHEFIEDVLHNELLTHEMKKGLILGSIKMAQYGDDMGSFILQQYYNLVDASL